MYGRREWVKNGSGRDTLYGQDGNDALYGGGERDWLYGNAGADRFYASSNATKGLFMDGGFYDDDTAPLGAHSPPSGSTAR